MSKTSEAPFDVSPRLILPPVPVAEFIQLDAGSGTNQDSMDNYTRLGPPTGPRVSSAHSILSRTSHVCCDQ